MDGVCILVPEAIRQLEAQGWSVVIADDGLNLRNGKLGASIPYQDSLNDLVDRGDVDDEVWRLRRAKNNRKRAEADR